jgi:hypothetical protein
MLHQIVIAVYFSMKHQVELLLWTGWPKFSLLKVLKWLENHALAETEITTSGSG